MRKIMRNLPLMAVFGVLNLGFGTEVFAAWERIVTCDDGAVVDVNTSERRNLQLVIRNESALRNLFDRGLIQLRYGDREAILGGWTQRGIFYPQDFASLGISLGGDLQARVVRQSNELHVYFERIVSWTEYPPECVGNELSMQCEGQGVFHSRMDFYGDYVFHGCN